MDPGHTHPTLESLILLVRGEIPVSAVDEEELAHLHALCPECRRLWPGIMDLLSRHAAEEETAAAERARLEDRAVRARLEADRRLAEVEVERLLDLDLAPAARREKVRRAYKRYRTPAFVERMIEEARIWVRHDCGEALELLAIAEDRLPKIRRDVYGQVVVSRLALRVLAHQANTCRVQGDLLAAEERFAEIHDRLGRAPLDDEALLAELASLEASLRYDQRRLGEAGTLLDRAMLLYEELGDGLGIAKAQIQRGMICYISGDSPEAVAHYEAAAAMIDAEVEPQLAFNARHNLVLCLCEVGQAEAARLLLGECRSLARRLSNPTTSSQLVWAEGKVAAARGDQEAAIERFRAARDAYSERGKEYDVALVCLDMSTVHLQRGETPEVKNLAERMIRAFSARHVGRETARAVALFAKAARAEALTLELIVRTRRTLLRAGGTAARPAQPAR